MNLKELSAQIGLSLTLVEGLNKYFYKTAYNNIHRYMKSDSSLTVEDLHLELWSILSTYYLTKKNNIDFKRSLDSIIKYLGFISARRLRRKYVTRAKSQPIDTLYCTKDEQEIEIYDNRITEPVLDHPDDILNYIIKSANLSKTMERIIRIVYEALQQDPYLQFLPRYKLCEQLNIPRHSYAKAWKLLEEFFI